MDAGLGGEGIFADIGRVTVGGAVEPLVERVRDLRQLLQLRVGDADVEFVGKFRLELQRRDDGDEIGVAAALAQPVERALDLPGAGAHGGERIGHRLLGVVVGVDADVVAGDRLHHLADDCLHLVRQRAAIGVAQHHPARALVVGRLGAGERVFGVGLVAVEEMLAVEQHFPALRLGGAHAVADRGDVFLLRRLQRHAHVVIPGLGDKADGVGLGVEQRGQPRIVGGRAARPPRHAEGGELGLQAVVLAEEFRVGRIGAGIAALDVIDAELVEHARDRHLVGEREVDAVGLRAVAQRGVEQIEPFARHRSHHR